MEQQIQSLYSLIDFKLAVLIIISSYWVKSNFTNVFMKISLAIKIFIWSTIISILYYFLGKMGLFEVGELYNLLITYFATTSFYELAFKPLEDFIKSKTDKNKNNVG